MIQQYAYFNELPLKTVFSSNGNMWVKRSTRTAKLVEYRKTFYFDKKHLCIVGEYSRLSANYFEKV